jgi:hypothetical protein
MTRPGGDESVRRLGAAHSRIPATWFGRFVFALGVVALGLIVAPIAKSFHWGGGVILAVGIVGLLWWLRR